MFFVLRGTTLFALSDRSARTTIRCLLNAERTDRSTASDSGFDGRLKGDLASGHSAVSHLTTAL
ncbi:MAG: hypothetical protein ACI3XQ_11840 [Eubacteriales bacterium]